MGLEKLQQALVRLYTDAALRAQFHADPAGTSKTLGLSAEEANQIASVPAKQIESFAYALHRKRSAEVRGLLPHTCHTLGKSFESLFATHAEQFRPQGHQKHQNDAIQFATFLSDNARHENVIVSIVEIARFESAFLKAHRSRCCLFMRVFKRDVKQIVHEIGNHAQITSNRFRFSLGIWFRMGSIQRFYYVRAPQLKS